MKVSLSLHSPLYRYLSEENLLDFEGVRMNKDEDCSWEDVYESYGCSPVYDEDQLRAHP